MHIKYLMNKRILAGPNFSEKNKTEAFTQQLTNYHTQLLEIAQPRTSV